jgi:hypothetical protein
MKPQIDGLIQNIFAEYLLEFDEPTEKILFGRDKNVLSSVYGSGIKKAAKEHEAQSIAEPQGDI